jgi:hypothetical protein
VFLIRFHILFSPCFFSKILELENLIKKYYTQKAEAATIRSRIQWAEEGERSIRYFFELEKKQGENKMWNRIKNTEGKYN